jgi:hypothetical protein
MYWLEIYTLLTIDNDKYTFHRDALDLFPAHELPFTT